MQITIEETEIKTAILDYVSKQGLTIHADAKVDLRAGRGENGMTATIDIGDVTVEASEPKKVTPIKKKEKVKAAEPEEAKEEKEEQVEVAANKPLFS